MSLDALAPDQRAVVQLVLQQDRSYEDLAALLGITPEAVRQRAHRGMERLAPGEAIDEADRAQIADYLLGQQSVSGREATRALLAADQPARSWALAIASELAGVARSALPEVPTGAIADAPPEPEPEPAITEPEITEPTIARAADPVLEEPIAPVRARPRPRQRAQTTPPVDFGFGEVTGDRDEKREPAPGSEQPARTSRLGGAMLVGGLAILVAVLVIFIVSRGSDDPESETATTGTTPTETATAGPTGSDFLPVASLALEPQDGSDAVGQMQIYVSPTQEAFGFDVIAEGLQPTTENRAYTIWLTGGPKDRFLGYAARVEEDGVLQASGPMEDDAANLPRWLETAEAFAISRENADPGASPNDVILQGQLENLVEAAPAATATP